MRETVLGVGMFSSTERATDTAEMPVTEPALEIRTFPSRRGWSQEEFARRQIQGLVNRMFLSDREGLVRQVVFSAVDAETEVRRICRKVGEALALETEGPVAVVGGSQRLLQTAERRERFGGQQARAERIPPLRRIATQVGGNLWLVPGAARNPATFASLHSYLGELRREFEYSIVEGPPAGESDEATAMAQFADGIVLVLSAQKSRRVTAVKIAETLKAAQARLLGTVLCDREFPVPERIYRRL